jgi:membrane protein
MLAALNVAYDESEQRGFLRYQATAFAITLAAILAVVVGLAILVFMPATLQFLGLTAHQKGLIQTISYIMLLVFVMASLSVLYRFGPSRQLAKWKWITPGSLLATALWLGVSALFSWYVANMASYDATYGPLAAVVGVLMWFYLTAFVVLLGAELNSELELQTARDSTTGPPKPIGKRGAYVADHVADHTGDQ